MTEGWIHVRVEKGKNTEIEVKDWPSREATWRIYSEGEAKGRKLVCRGFSNFDPDTEVGHIVLHVEDARPLRVVSFQVGDNVLADLKDEVLRELLLCAKCIAEKLAAKQHGTGILEWELQTSKAAGMLRLYPRFQATRKPGDKRGTTVLRQT